MKKFKDVKLQKKGFFIFVSAFINALSIAYLAGITSSNGGYFGTETFGWNPACIAFFALDCILLHRFFKKEAISDKRRVIISAVFALPLSLLTVWGAYMLYGNNSFSGEGRNIAISVVVAVGLSFLTIPCLSEIIGFLSMVSDRTKKDGEKEEKSFLKGGLLYLLAIWCLVFASFIPLFLYHWPINFVYDADYQLHDYLTNSMTTHHSILHTLFLGKTYEWGLQRGNVNSGMMIYSLVQMGILSFAVAFFMEYLFEKRVRKSIRIAALFVFLLNPANAWFAISTIKGVLSAAFILIALTFALRFLDTDSKKHLKRVLYAAGIVLSSTLSCHFRNNMIYAVVAGGVLILLLQKKIKRIIPVILITASIFLAFKVSENILMKAYNVRETDTERESMSLPLSCLARVAVREKDTLTDAEYGEIISYIPENALSEYSFVIADGIKKDANEALLKSNKINFLKLVVKVGLKHPVSYLESVTGMTLGYWYPLEYPYFLTGTTKLYNKNVYDGYPSVENMNYLPMGSGIFDYMYGEKEGRLKIPLLGNAWRSSFYVLTYFAAFAFLLYKKDRRGLALMMIPFMYMLSCFLAPVAWIRYIYINIAAMPVITYLCTYANRKE